MLDKTITRPNATSSKLFSIVCTPKNIIAFAKSEFSPPCLPGVIMPCTSVLPLSLKVVASKKLLGKFQAGNIHATNSTGDINGPLRVVRRRLMGWAIAASQSISCHSGSKAEVFLLPSAGVICMSRLSLY